MAQWEIRLLEDAVSMHFKDNTDRAKWIDAQVPRSALDYYKPQKRVSPLRKLDKWALGEQDPGNQHPSELETKRAALDSLRGIIDKEIKELDRQIGDT